MGPPDRATVVAVTRGLSVCIEAKSNENRLEEFLIVLNGAVEIADIV